MSGDRQKKFDNPNASTSPKTIHLNHGSLFSGGGGFEIAAELMGWNNVFNCEIDPFCNKLLKYYWPQSHHFNDIRQFDATPFKGKIDIITGGFPCQPFSMAGKRKGTADSRHLWPEMLRIISEVMPTWVVGENVYGILNWNGGLVFEQVHTDLEALGYEVQAFILPACGVNAPHRRYRVWFIAYSDAGPRCTKEYPTERNREKIHHSEWKNIKAQFTGHGISQYGSDTNVAGLERRENAGSIAKGWKKHLKQYARLCKRGYWNHWPTQPALCGGNDGIPTKLDGITFSKWRRESIKLYGNAIVPQVVYQIFKVIDKMNEPH